MHRRSRAFRLGPVCGALGAICVAAGCLEGPERLEPAPVDSGADEERGPEQVPPSDAYETVEFEVGFAAFPTEEEIEAEGGEGVVSPEAQAGHWNQLLNRTPLDVWFRVHEVQFANEADCDDLESVADDDHPDLRSFGSRARLYDGRAPYGTYRCVALTVGTEFWWYGRSGSGCDGYHRQTLHTPDGGDTITLYLSTADLQELSQAMSGAPLYALDRAYRHSRWSYRTRFELDVWNTLDLDTCTMAAPGFGFTW